METIELDKVRFKGYAFQIEMKFTAKQCGFKIKEVPVIFVNRELGTSKMSGGIFSEAVFGSSAYGSMVGSGAIQNHLKIKHLQNHFYFGAD